MAPSQIQIKALCIFTVLCISRCGLATYSQAYLSPQGGLLTSASAGLGLYDSVYVPPARHS